MSASRGAKRALQSFSAKRTWSWFFCGNWNNKSHDYHILSFDYHDFFNIWWFLVPQNWDHVDVFLVYIKISCSPLKLAITHPSDPPWRTRLPREIFSTSEALSEELLGDKFTLRCHNAQLRRSSKGSEKGHAAYRNQIITDPPTKSRESDFERVDHK